MNTNIPKEAQTSCLLDKDFETTILRMLKELKKVMGKYRKMMYEQNQSINEEI